MRRKPAGDRGASLVALIASVTIMLIGMTMAMPTWRYINQQDKEEELVFRGFAIVRAIRENQLKAGTFPISLKQMKAAKYLREEYLDPMTDTKFNLVNPVDQSPACVRQANFPTATPDPNATPTPTPPKKDRQPPPPRPSPPPPDRNTNSTWPDGMRLAQAGFGFPNLFARFDEDEVLIAQGSSPTPPRQQQQQREAEAVGAPFVGVTSRSKIQSLGVFNSRNHYHEWCFSVNVIDPSIVTLTQLKYALMRLPKGQMPTFDDGKAAARKGSDSSD